MSLKEGLNWLLIQSTLNFPTCLMSTVKVAFFMSEQCQCRSLWCTSFWLNTLCSASWTSWQKLNALAKYTCENLMSTVLQGPQSKHRTAFWSFYHTHVIFVFSGMRSLRSREAAGYVRRHDASPAPHLRARVGARKVGADQHGEASTLPAWVRTSHGQRALALSFGQLFPRWFSVCFRHCFLGISFQFFPSLSQYLTKGSSSAPSPVGHLSRLLCSLTPPPSTSPTPPRPEKESLARPSSHSRMIPRPL